MACLSASASHGEAVRKQKEENPNAGCGFVNRIGSLFQK